MLLPILDHRAVVNERLIDELLRDEQELTAVERFARWSKENHSHGSSYRDRIPLEKPAPGVQYAFQVNLDDCSGCKACVAACHSLNGLDEEETWRSVGLLQGGYRQEPFLQHITTACHHCLEPACMHGCPVNAYEKDALTGIVRHLDDQCIGCRYCTLTCPYGAPKYNRAKGIVRKCDMCSERLAHQEAPACVQACPSGAIRITLVDEESIVADSESDVFLPGSPGSRFTLPTTRYISGRPLPQNALPADYYHTEPEHAHLSLVIMLILTQLAVGTLVVSATFPWLGWDRLLPNASDSVAVVALLTGLLGMAAAACHLGRPHLAFRAILGLRRSWLSREIIAFGLFAGTSALYAFSLLMDMQDVSLTLGVVASLTGLAAVYCSVMIYVSTNRVFWSLRNTAFLFFTTSAILGLSVCLLLWLLSGGADSSRRGVSNVLTYALAILVAGKLATEATLFTALFSKGLTSLKRTALLCLRDLRRITFVRYAAPLLSVLFLLLSAQAAPAACLALCVMSAVLIGCGEFAERYLFFRAVVAPKMPGGAP